MGHFHSDVARRRVAGQAVAQSVVDQVVEHAFEQSALGQHKHWHIEPARAQVHAQGIGTVQMAHQRVAHHLVERDVLRLQNLLGLFGQGQGQ